LVVDPVADEGFAKPAGLSGEALAFALGHETGGPLAAKN